MSNKVTPASGSGAGVSRKRSMFADLLSHSKHSDEGAALDPSKFEALMALNLGFSEDATTFADFTHKLEGLLDADLCQLWLVDEAEHNLYTFVHSDKAPKEARDAHQAQKAKDAVGSGNPGGTDDDIKMFKPMDRGIGSAVVSSIEGIVVEKVATNPNWDASVDEVLTTGSVYKTVSYIAWPLKNQSGDCIGLVEARNKRGGHFTQADAQLVRIFAHQVSTAVSQFKQNALLADRNDNLQKAYEKDTSDAIKLSKSTISSGAPSKLLAQADAKEAQMLGKKNGAAYASESLGVKIETSKQLQRWEYDVFKQSEDELNMLFVDVFEDRGLFTRFSIDIKVFLAFTREVMNGYSKTTPYHNFFHGFDVMHVCYLLVSTCDADGYLEDFNILSLLVGAIAHDVGHDGFNNAFHSVTMSELAVTYNSISIMENYSAAYLFRILKKQNCNIFSRISEGDYKKLRGRLIDMILDTDAKNHFILMTRFKHGLEMKQLSRGLLSSMILHIADVSNPTRPGPVSRQWAFAVQEEFFRQGDKEKELGLAISPFMDRQYENLPRMQGAFTDALVSPVFHLTAEFLPKIAETCIRSMQVNRAFWNNLQTKQILTTPGIKDYLDTKDPAETEKEEKAAEVAADQAAADSDAGKPNQDEGGMGFNASIPGIPQNAPHSPGSSKRKMSLIAMRSAQEEADLEAVANAEAAGIGKEPSELLSPRSIELKKKKDREMRKQATMAMLDGNVVQVVMLCATAYALVADDLSKWTGSGSNDAALSIVTFVVLVLFTVELFVSVYCVPEYMHFFFWLDLVASLSLIPEVDFLVDDGSSTGVEDQATLTRAGRAAKAGARAGRLARMLRLLRLVRIIKLVKWVGSFVKRQMKNELDNAEDVQEEAEMKMSNVGRKMTESITRKVILAVMFMLLTFGLFDTVMPPDARVQQLNDVALYPAIADDLVAAYSERYGGCFYLRYADTTIEGCDIESLDDDWVYSSDDECMHPPIVPDENVFDASAGDGGEHKTLRVIEQEVIISELDPRIMAIFDISAETQNTAMQSFVMTCVVTVLLAVLSMAFSRDAYNIMIRPIEKMKHTVQQLSENPLLHLKKLEEQGSGPAGESETDMLEHAITKMARLLQIGFGSAGAEIIANNLSEGGELNPMVPGSKVEAIFGFCDIRDFTFATEGLQQDVMLFVNKIADITHRYVVESGGAPNKNIGDAFLLVWKLHGGVEDPSGRRGDLQKELYDASLVSFLKIIRDIKRMGNLAAFLEGADENAAWRASLADFKVAMGFGLHTGWAIEGSIGSKVKVDASYLSPHVNLASRLEAATK
ncbi:hypothetical protein TeGR_g15162 [Tetraparma gracilis]|uniref:Phosphodiesterase n=1 Tax=Tetraparma gracilis TaxID=2962635 RepID=A0ABQ6MTK6_9STRA|nr:hypothetical protein TeGR_g15162 [Tetraparma gracilis]